MTTSVKIHVNGRYRANVQQDGNSLFIVHGNYEGSPNPSGEHTLYVCHPANTTISITEEPVPEFPVGAVDEALVDQPVAEEKPVPEANQTTI